jgi:hypothetical protein
MRRAHFNSARSSMLWRRAPRKGLGTGVYSILAGKPVGVDTSASFRKSAYARAQPAFPLALSPSKGGLVVRQAHHERTMMPRFFATRHKCLLL